MSICLSQALFIRGTIGVEELLAQRDDLIAAAKTPTARLEIEDSYQELLTRLGF